MENYRYRQARFITVMGSIKNALLACLKIIFGILGHSQALFADGIHSLSDLIIDGIVLVASRISSKAADYDHPYGHARVETAATVLLALVLILVSMGIIYEAVQEIFTYHILYKPSIYVFGIAIISVLINEMLFHYTARVGKKIDSQLLVTNAWHHRSDSAASLVVLIGITATWLGFTRLDSVAAIVVALMIIKMAWKFGWDSIRELVDTASDISTIEKIKAVILSTSGVRSVHQLRTRLMRGSIFCDAHILVDPMISVSEGHFIGHRVHFNLMEKIPAIADVIVHIDPEDDECETPTHNLPSRAELSHLLKEKWKELLPASIVDQAVFHYLAGKIQLQLTLPSSYANHENLKISLRSALQDIKSILSINLSYSLDEVIAMHEN